ncbi:MAG: DUF255 domain-containing protein [Fuerstiella sp.]
MLVAIWFWSPFQADAPTATAQEPEQMRQQQEHAHTNHLIGQTSPYLLQHAHNPVDWHPWGEEAFARAKRENKPIFLSVGYSTCYWCHVMEVESFEDAEVASIINKYFVAIKVDREERPDIDEQYMFATQLVTRRGGWPNSVWLTPDGKPWMAGTYFPRPQFIQVLKQLADVWQNRRDDVDRQADSFAKAVQKMSLPDVAEGVALTPQLIRQAVTQLVSRFDARHGGFGGAPRFPPHGTLRLLIWQYRVTGQESLLKPISATLDAMWLGGMHDHIGGGFHRYATDAEWLLPHFEKMLYDNAQLMRAYADGFQITGSERYRAAVADINRWVKREMTSPEGAFYSALDSGEVGKEGNAYVWPMNRLGDVLSGEDAALFAKVYNFQSRGNYKEESTGERSGTNIPHLKRPVEAIAGLTESTEHGLAHRLSEMRNQLLAERQTWPQPHKDDKVLTSWNGLMIGSLAYAGRLLDEPSYVEAASDAADFILDNMVRDDILLRTYRNGHAKLPGYLDDYVFFTQGLLELHLATGDSRWLNQADRFATTLVKDFEDNENGGFFFTTTAHEDLMVRSRHLSGGGNMPNPNGVAAQVLIQIAELTDDPAYQKSAKRLLESLSGFMADQPHSSEDLLIATSQYLADTKTESVGIDNAATSLMEAASGELSQRVTPLTFRVNGSSPGVQPGDEITITVAIDIDEGWHLYALNPQAEFLIPSTVTVAANEQFTIGKIKTPKSHSQMDSILKQTLNTYAGRIEFTIPVTISTHATIGKTTLLIEARTQACDMQRCLQPQTTTLRFPLQIKSKASDAAR